MTLYEVYLANGEAVHDGGFMATEDCTPSTKLWSECPRCDNGIYNGRECAICWGTGRVTESLLQQEAAAQPQIDDQEERN